MNNPSSVPQSAEQPTAPTQPQPTRDSAEPQPSYVKLAMRNMVRKGGTSLKHFGLTVIGLVSVLVGLAYLTR